MSLDCGTCRPAQSPKITQTPLKMTILDIMNHHQLVLASLPSKALLTLTLKIIPLLVLLFCWVLVMLFSDFQCLFSLPSPFGQRVKKCFTWRRRGGWLERYLSQCDRYQPAWAQEAARFSTQSVWTDGQLRMEVRTVLANCVALWTSDCVRFR